MKSLILTLLAFTLTLATAFAMPTNEVDTTEFRPFVITINMDRDAALSFSFENAQEMVQITLMEAKNGIVFIKRVEAARFEENIPAEELLEAGEYTLLVEYAGRPVKTHRFDISEK